MSYVFLMSCAVQLIQYIYILCINKTTHIGYVVLIWFFFFFLQNLYAYVFWNKITFTMVKQRDKL